MMNDMSEISKSRFHLVELTVTFKFFLKLLIVKASVYLNMHEVRTDSLPFA